MLLHVFRLIEIIEILWISCICAILLVVFVILEVCNLFVLGRKISFLMFCVWVIVLKTVVLSACFIFKLVCAFVLDVFIQRQGLRVGVMSTFLVIIVLVGDRYRCYFFVLLLRDWGVVLDVNIGKGLSLQHIRLSILNVWLI
ncbi:hypothetical protein BDV98DRAFT_5541 [Pterulicium gracile]|uniref:Uncharacterized protein n=1 Tax=Pterulicium gracile TaxID=1884261 RepID=A0A5C3R286_9AGAR|nr:hypothetical protein BDV98DRAFT_5541 [Pterula gracilis]